jgi:hypothetical protein
MECLHRAHCKNRNFDGGGHDWEGHCYQWGPWHALIPVFTVTVWDRPPCHIEEEVTKVQRHYLQPVSTWTGVRTLLLLGRFSFFLYVIYTTYTLYIHIWYWGYTVTFTKVLTIYHSWILPLHHFHLFTTLFLPISGTISTGLLFPLTDIILHHIQPPSTFPICPAPHTATNPQTGPVLVKVLPCSVCCISTPAGFWRKDGKFENLSQMKLRGLFLATCCHISPLSLAQIFSYWCFGRIHTETYVFSSKYCIMKNVRQIKKLKKIVQWIPNNSSPGFCLLLCSLCFSTSFHLSPKAYLFLSGSLGPCPSVSLIDGSSPTGDSS